MRFYFDQALLRTGVAIEPSGIVERARYIRAFAWIEQRLFEVVGGWASRETDAMLKVLFDTESRVHGWNSLLWKDEMPPEGSLRAEQVLSSEDLNILVAPGFVTVLDSIEANGRDVGVVSYAHLGILCRVILPRLLLTYRIHMASLSPVTDGSFARSISIVYDDIVDLWHAASLTFETEWMHRVSESIGDDSHAATADVASHVAGMEFDEYVRWAEAQINGMGGVEQSEITIGLLRYRVGYTPSSSLSAPTSLSNEN